MLPSILQQSIIGSAMVGFCVRTDVLKPTRGEHSLQLHRNDDAGNADNRHAADGTAACVASQ